MLLYMLTFTIFYHQYTPNVSMDPMGMIIKMINDNNLTFVYLNIHGFYNINPDLLYFYNR